MSNRWKCVKMLSMQRTFSVSLQDKEVSYGAHAPRILALDDYFLMEVEKSEQDPDTGKKIKKKVRQQKYISC